MLSIKTYKRELILYLTITILASFLLIDRLFLLDFTSRAHFEESFYGKVISEHGYGGDLILSLIPQKYLILIILYLGAYSVCQLIDKKTQQKTVYFACMLYIINPFVYIRIMTGQLYLLFSYAILPLLIKFFIDALEKRRIKEVTKFIFALSIVAFNIHILIISFIIMATILIFWFNKHRDIRITKYIVLSAILFILLNSYWIIPVLTEKDTKLNNITDKDYEVFTPKGSLFDIATMYGFWREGYIYAKDFIPGWQILYLIILSLAIIGFKAYYKDEKIGYLVMAFGLIAILGLILALGIKGPLNILYEFDNPILKGFRDSQKFVAMLVFSYSILGGLGIEKLKSRYDNLG